MIQRFRLVENVGQFQSVSTGATLPLDQLTVVYAENGRGKTTIAAILRSLATGDPIFVEERQRLAAAEDPHVVVECSGGTTPAIFRGGSWTRTFPEISIFDDAFVNENVYSGLVVEAGHRQNMHELILGAAGIALTERVEELRQRASGHATRLRQLEAAIPVSMRGDLSADAFCALQPRAEIDEEIVEAERALAAARESGQVASTSSFDVLALPKIDTAAITDLVHTQPAGLDAAATAIVEEHLSMLGLRAGGWVTEGLGHLDTAQKHDSNSCPFCAQDMTGSTIVEHYRAYFGQVYAEHATRIREERSRFDRAHGADVIAGFERNVRYASERQDFWSRYADIPRVDLDTAEIVTSWQAAIAAVSDAFDAKSIRPLDGQELSGEAVAALHRYEAHRDVVAEKSLELQEANRVIAAVKERARAGDVQTLERDLARLRANKASQSDGARRLCSDFLAEKTARDSTEAERTRARADLDAYRRTAFPGYEDAINMYLGRFNAEFRLAQITPTNTAGGPGCTYQVTINNTNIPVTGSPERPGEPSFRTTLSAGDRNTLALAFFFASLDRDPNLASRVVVIDDPLSSLDEHRQQATVQEIRALAGRAQQVIVLSHTRSFACAVWESFGRNAARSALQVERAAAGSTLAAWDVAQQAETEHDRRFRLLSSYLDAPAGAPRPVAEALRPHLESFLRVSFPGEFRVSTMLGPFKVICDQRVGSTQEILSRTDADELQNLIEYANRFHHDTNPAWQTAAVNDIELQGFVRRTLEFVRRT
jgi:wobble nucleotide-excising tRNase